MSDEELTKCVDAWIESRELAGELAALADQWTDVSGRYGPGSAPAMDVLLALVREAWDCRSIYVESDAGTWEVWNGDGAAFSINKRFSHDPNGPETIVFDTEADALVAALEAAPR